MVEQQKYNTIFKTSFYNIKYLEFYIFFRNELKYFDVYDRKS